MKFFILLVFLGKIQTAAAGLTYHAHESNKCKYMIEAHCPPGMKWHQDQKICVPLEDGKTCPEEKLPEPRDYLFIDTKKNWSLAAKHCRDLDAYLAEPRTKWQVDYLQKLAVDKSVNMWIGATDLAVEGQWVWAHSGADVDGPTDWYPGQPNNRAPFPDVEEDCLEIGGYKERGWFDFPCDFPQPFVCQREETTV